MWQRSWLIASILTMVGIFVFLPLLTVYTNDVANAKMVLTSTPDSQIVVDSEKFEPIYHFIHESALDIALNQDNSILAVATYSGVQLYDFQSLEFIEYLIERPVIGQYSIAWSFDGSKLALSGMGIDGIEIWDTDDKQLLQVLQTGNEDRRFVSIAWSPSSDRVVAQGGFIWDVETGEFLHQLGNSDSDIGHVVWSPDGSWLVSEGRRTVEIWDSYTFEKQDHSITLNDSVTDVDWSSDGRYIVASSSDKIVIWEMATNTVSELSSDSGAEAIVLSPSGTKLAAQDVRDITIWDLTTGEPISAFDQHISRPTRLLWLPDDARLISMSEWDTARIWNVENGVEEKTLEDFEGFLTSVALSLGGSQVAATNSTNDLIIWNTVDGQFDRREAVLDRRNDYLAWSPDGTYLAAASGLSNVVKIWNIGDEEQVAELIHENDVTDIAWSPDGASIAIAARFKVYIWDTSTFEERLVIEAEPQTPLGGFGELDWSPDAAQLAIITNESGVSIWDAIDGTMEQVIFSPYYGSCCGLSIAWSPDGVLLAASVIDSEAAGYTTYIWDITTGQVKTTIADTDFPEIIWFSNGDYLIREGQQFEIWDIGTGHLVDEVTDNIGLLHTTDIDLSENRMRLVTMSRREIIVWSLLD